MKKWHTGEIVPVTQTVYCTTTVAKTFKIRARISMRVRTFQLLDLNLFIKTVQTMAIVMTYRTVFGTMAAITIRWKFRTTAQVFNTILLLNLLHS